MNRPGKPKLRILEVAEKGNSMNLKYPLISTDLSLKGTKNKRSSLYIHKKELYGQE